MKTISVIGSGSWGTALAIHLAKLGNNVKIWSFAKEEADPVLTLFITEHYLVPGSYLIFSIIVAVIVLFNHRSNIKRILTGTENKISFKK